MPLINRDTFCQNNCWLLSEKAHSILYTNENRRVQMESAKFNRSNEMENDCMKSSLEFFFFLFLNRAQKRSPPKSIPTYYVHMFVYSFIYLFIYICTLFSATNIKIQGFAFIYFLTVETPIKFIPQRLTSTQTRHKFSRKFFHAHIPSYLLKQW